MATEYDGSIKLGLEIETAEAEKRFDKLAKNIESRTSEISKDAGNEMRDTFQEIVNSAETITPEMEKITKAAMKQADAIDAINSKKEALIASVDTYRNKYDKATEAIYNQKLKVDELKAALEDVKTGETPSKYMTDLQKNYNKLDAQSQEMYAKRKELEAEIAEMNKSSAENWQASIAEIEQQMREIRADSSLDPYVKSRKLEDLTIKKFDLGNPLSAEEEAYLSKLKEELKELHTQEIQVDNELENISEKLQAVQANPELLPEAQKYANELAIAEATLGRLEAERETMTSGAEQKLTAEAQNLANAYGNADNNADALKYTLQDIVEEQSQAELEAEQFVENEHEVERTEAQINNHVTIQHRLFQKLKSLAADLVGKFREMHRHSSAMNMASNLIDKTLGRIRKKIWGMIRRVFIFSVMTKALRKIRSLLSNIFSTSPEMTEYFGKIKANLLTAFAPLWDYVIPIFKQVLAILVTATQRLAEIMSAIFGKTIKQSQESAKALEAQAKATDKTAKATDKLNKTLGHLDELNTDISTENDTSAGDEETSSLVFDDFAISPEIMERVNRFKELLSALFEPLKKSWDKNGPKVKRAATRMFNSLISLASSVGDSFMEVWTNGSAEEMFDNLFEIISNIMDIVGNLADAFKKAWDNAGLGTRIIQHIFDIINNILSHVKEITKAIADWAAELDFEPILQAFDDLLVALEPFIDMTLDGLDFIVKEILLPLAEWAIEEAIPAALDAVSGAITGLKDVAEALKPFGKWLWEEFLKPLGEWTGSVIIGALDTLSGAFESLGKWIKENNGPLTEFLKIMTLVLVPVAAGKWIIGLLASAFTAVKTALVGAGILSGGGLIGAFLGPTGIIALLGLLVIAGGKGEEVIEDLKGAFKGLGDFLSGVFTGNWEKALLGILNLCVNFTNLLIDMINGAINAIVRGAASINGFTIPGIGTINFPSELENFDVGIPRIKEITHLAHGTVVPPSSREFLAMLGDNNQETEVVSPLSTMKDALLEALEAYGGNNGEQQITLQIDGNDLFRWLVQKNKETYLQTGQNMLIY